MARIRPLSDGDLLQLLQLASGLLQQTEGDIVAAMSLAMPLHVELLRTIRDDEIRSDLGPGDAVLYVPEQGGLAIRIERHPPRFDDEAGAEPYADLDITGFEVSEPESSHFSLPSFDAGVLEDWD